MEKDYYAQLEEREGIKRRVLSLEETFGPDWDRKHPECDMCQFQKKGYCCPCKTFIEFLEERGLELARDRRKLEARISKLEEADKGIEMLWTEEDTPMNNKYGPCSPSKPWRDVLKKPPTEEPDIEQEIKDAQAQPGVAEIERLAEVAHQTLHVGRWKFPWANETDEIKEGWGNVVRAILNMRNISPDESFPCEKCQNRMVYSNSKGWYCPNCGWIPPSNKRHQNLSRKEETD